MTSRITSAALALSLVIVALFARPLRADDTITVKLATVAPEGTSWYNGLREMGDKWAQITGGKVQVKIYPGGVAGHEGTVVRKMRIGQLQGGALSNLGLLDIDPAAQVTNTPMLIQSYDELDYVMSKMAPVFEQRLVDKGFVVLNWGEAGWVRFFTNGPMRVPADTHKFKFWVWDGDPGAVVVYREAGLNPVVIASVDMIPSLQSGLIDGFPSSPLAALSMQWFALAPNMLDVPWAPLVGATVITKDTWDRIPAQYHEQLKAVAAQIGEDLKSEVRKQDGKAVEVMKRYGLQVTQVDAATRKLWEDKARSIYPQIRGDIVPTDIFDQTQAAVKEYRSR